MADASARETNGERQKPREWERSTARKHAVIELAFSRTPAPLFLSFFLSFFLYCDSTSQTAKSPRASPYKSCAPRHHVPGQNGPRVYKSSGPCPGMEIAQFPEKEIRFGIIAPWKGGLSRERSRAKWMSSRNGLIGNKKFTTVILQKPCVSTSSNRNLEAIRTAQLVKRRTRDRKGHGFGPH